MKLKLLLLSLLTTTILSAAALSVSNGYVRATPPGVPNSAAFMQLQNHAKHDISVMSAHSNIAKKVELHTHDMVNGEMQMYQVKKIDIPANGKTILQPGGFHIMLLGLHKPLKIGSLVGLTLTLYSGEEIKIKIPVKKVMAGMRMQHGTH
ncbi:MAG: copper chaperone PCu(A)C [Thiovulaceae bacterium]|nr:copper chaperone PCu(A)C [Sulfurimonadaceae bacterium]